MQKYLYTFRYHHEDLLLYKLELEHVFDKKDFEERTFLSDEFIPMEDSCFGEVILEILGFSENFDDLKVQLKELPVFDDAKLDSLSLGFLPKCSFNDAVKLLPYLKFHANMKNPANIYLLTRNNEGWYFGRKVSESRKLWNHHRSKPLTMSSAIPHILARTIVEILKYTGHKSLIDYCCGSGTFMLESCSFGLETFGIDLNPTMVDMSSKNLQHFSYEAQVNEANAIEYSQKADCGIVDFPYGFHCPRDEKAETAIVKNVMNKVKTGVFICGSECPELFREYKITHFFKVPAVNVTRNIYFCTVK
ncbi:MAG: hypothetical protein NE327_19300 [Lentisphaeraceae bacterium]|nr:hypothetical protein [Lentisphaeraceae bacterium]